MQVLDIGDTVIANDNNFSREVLQFQLEAVLNVLLHFLEGVRDTNKLKNYEELRNKISDFFLSDNMKIIFVGQDTHHLITNKYLYCIVQLRCFMIDEQRCRTL